MANGHLVCGYSSLTSSLLWARRIRGTSEEPFGGFSAELVYVTEVIVTIGQSSYLLLIFNSKDRVLFALPRLLSIYTELPIRVLRPFIRHGNANIDTSSSQPRLLLVCEV